ncbi:MAG: hypothetical protein WBN89_04560 [Prochlorococcaceae cyanobacterium]
MGREHPAGDALTFTIGGCLFGAGVFLFLNQVMVHSGFTQGGGGWGWRGGFGGWGGALPFGTPGMGLLMIPLGIGVCLLFTGSFQRWARLLVWGSLAALFVGVLNSVRISFRPATLWQLVVYVVMIASGGGLMFRSLDGYRQPERVSPDRRPDPRGDEDDLRRDLAELRKRVDELKG